MKDALIVSMLSLVPRNRAARGMGWFARSGLSKLVTRTFVWAYGVDLSEAERPLFDYDSLEDLFTRELAPGARPVDRGANTIVSPVDGRCAFVGRTERGVFPIADGMTCSIPDLLGEDLHGEVDVVVLYLSPRDYHRVHVPREGRAVRWRYTPGTLWPVFPAAVRRVKGLFEGNERMAVKIATAGGFLHVVLVGAFGVGRITMSGGLTDVVSNIGAKASQGDTDVRLERAQELGVFHLGSTVVLVAPPGKWEWSVQKDDPVAMGRAIGKIPTAR